MLKKMLLAVTASLIFAGATMAMAPVPAEAKSRCDARADSLYPYNKSAHKAFKKNCKANRRAWKKRNDKGIWIIL